MRSEPVEILQDHLEPPSLVAKRGVMPLLKTALYTLDISSRFLARTVMGTASVESADKLLDGYWRRIFTSGNGSLRASGRHHFAKGQSYILMSNHGSLLDIPALMGAVPCSMRMVMKQSLQRVPVWGPALVASGFVPIDRQNRTRAIEQLEKAKKMVQSGVSIWISPEGTRSKDGQLGPFKKGGFHVALDLGVPIIPLWIEGTASMVPPRKLYVEYHRSATVRFGAPISTQGRGKDQLPELMAEVRASIVELSGRPDPLGVPSAAAALSG
ncbi:MAG: lysophospholipid acyltransferase family protein [Myxococcaceae bacterium]